MSVPRPPALLHAFAAALAAVLAAAPALLAGEHKPPKPEPGKPQQVAATVAPEPPKPKAPKPKAPKPKPLPKPTLPNLRDAALHGRYDEALKLAEALLPKAPPADAMAARLLRVQVLRETGQYDKARDEATALAKQAPRQPNVLAALAETLIETGRYEEAAKRLAAALQLDKEHIKTRRLSLELAEITGDNPAAQAQMSYFFDLYRSRKAATAEALTAVARAVQNEDPHGAWGAYQDAQQEDPYYADAWLLGGFLCLEKYAWPFATQSFNRLVKLNPNLAVAHAGLASVLLANSKYDKALESIETALKANPHLPLAHELKAAILGVERKHAESLAEIRAALKINPRSLSALSLLAAHYEAVVKPGKRDETIAHVLKINPAHAEVYNTLSITCQRLRRSPSAIAWARKAIKLRPRYWRGYYLAGMNLVRAGEEKEGYELLERAFELNRFNVWAANTLTVLDRDLKRKEFVYHQTPHFFVKLDRTEDPILWPYLELMLEPMYDKLTRKYRFEPTGPMLTTGKVLVLLFPKHSEFSARTIGLPGLSALGACLGQVITMPSPAFGRRRRSGPFNWRQVLVHEFAHVVTLQKTRYHIPRWLTEGISVWEEDDTRVKWDQMLKHALAEGQLLPLEDLDRGFVRPKFRTQVPLSYYQAFLITRHFSETYGNDAILKMLELYHDGEPTAQVLAKATGKPLKTLNAQTLDYIRRYAKAIRLATQRIDKKTLDKLEAQAKKDDKNADLWTRIALGRLMARKTKQAREAAQRAVKLDPKLARAHAVLGFIAYTIDKKPQAAKKHYLAAKAADPDYFPARLYLGLIARDDFSDEAIRELEAARRLAPRFIQRGRNPYLLLARLYRDEGQPHKAIAMLRQLCKLDSNDAKARVELAELLTQQAMHPEAAATYLDAIYIDPFDLAIHMAAARAYEAAKDPTQAAREYGVAAAIDPKNLKPLVGWARTLAASGQPTVARKALAAIRKLDPDNPDAAAIEKSLGN